MGRRLLAAWAFGFAFAAAYAAIRYVPAAGWVTNSVTTGESPAYPDLQPRLYDSAPDNTTVVASAVANRVLGWRVVKTDVPSHTVVCAVSDIPGVVIDDLTLRVEPVAGPYGTSSRVIVQSRSRIGPGDLGMNARHVRALQAAMDDKLPPLTTLK